MSPRRPLTHWLLLVALVAMWGSSFLFTKIAVAAIAPTDVVAGRFVLASLVLSILLIVTRRRLPASGRLWLFVVAMALIGNCLPFWLITWGQQRIDSGLAGILMAIMPLATVMLAHFFVAGERLNRFKAGGFLIGFLGIVVLMGPQVLLELRGGGTALLSELAVLAGALCYAVNSIIARRRPPSDALVVSTGVALAAVLVMGPASALAGPPDLGALPLSALVAVAVLGVVSTATATVVYFNLITLAGPSFLSLINYLIPVWAVVIGMLFLGERPAWTAFAGLALILSGIALAETKGRRAG
ncbi:MAG: DMT family transporter [Kiloniellales bacterium]|nr:DMT family transporter [Kiloniellales bacterium]